MSISAKDRETLRDLARRLAEVAALPIMAERRRLWKAHNALRGERPMVLIFPEGSWRELLPDSALTCEGDKARGYEWHLRMRLYHHQHLPDDTVVEGEFHVAKAIHTSGWGLEPKRHPSTTERGAWSFSPVIHEPKDLEQLRYPEVTHDEAASAARLAEAQELFGDILNVRLLGQTRFGFHLMAIYTRLRGLEQVMWDMMDEPEMLHDAMAFLEAGEAHRIQQYFDLDLVELNNDGSYHSSGGNGYTDELPREGCDPAHPRRCDLWASAEAQELAPVSPAMHEEFCLQYERRLLAPFGLNGYGCCEPLDRKLEDVLTIPNIRRISISPFADVRVCAEALGDRAIFSWKPHPSHLVGEFDEAYVRNYIQEALAATRGCHLEMILKDTHTCEHHPERFTRWGEIACELAAES